MPGEGSCFHAVLSFRLPGESEPGTDHAAGTIGVGWASIEAGRYAGKRVLVAEDDEDSQGLIRTVMKKFGFEVDIAENGQEAVRRLKAAERPYDLVLMDIRMPEMGGLEATRVIRASHAMQDLPIVALSANAFDEDRQQSLNAGMNEHLVKPLEVGRLDRVLRIVLG